MFAWCRCNLKESCDIESRICYTLAINNCTIWTIELTVFSLSLIVVNDSSSDVLCVRIRFRALRVVFDDRPFVFGVLLDFVFSNVLANFFSCRLTFRFGGLFNFGVEDVIWIKQIININKKQKKICVNCIYIVINSITFFIFCIWFSVVIWSIYYQIFRSAVFRPFCQFTSWFLSNFL